MHGSGLQVVKSPIQRPAADWQSDAIMTWQACQSIQHAPVTGRGLAAARVEGRTARTRQQTTRVPATPIRMGASSRCARDRLRDNTLDRLRKDTYDQHTPGQVDAYQESRPRAQSYLNRQPPTRRLRWLGVSAGAPAAAPDRRR